MYLVFIDILEADVKRNPMKYDKTYLEVVHPL